jgi:YVTN family beta-propeller protein
MEYLMTYGWAILIIAVVLGALYSLGIFNGANFLGGTCIAAPGYLCTNPLLGTSGLLNFTYGYQGSNVTIVGFACTNTTTSPSSFKASGLSSLEPGQEESVGATCPLSSSATIGTQYSGYLWVEYDQAGQSDLIARFATLQTSVALNNSGYDKAFVVLYGTGKVDVIDTSNYVILDSIPVGSQPRDIALTPNDDYAYVTDYASGTVSVINTHTYNVVTIPVGSYPFGIAMNPNGEYAYVGRYVNPGGVNVISTSNNVVTNTITFGTGTMGGDVSHNGDYLYVGDADSYYRVIYTSNDVIATSVYCADPWAIATTSDDSVGFLSTNGANLEVINPLTCALSKYVSAGGSLQEGMALSPDGTTLYAANTGGSTVGVVNVAGESLSTTLNVGSEPIGLALTTDGKYLYVDNFGSSTINVIAVANDVAIKTINTGASSDPDGIAIT